MFSRSCEYAIRACIYIASHCESGRPVTIKDIAGATDSPEAFVAKISQTLVKEGIVRSRKGPQGGFYIDSEQCQSVKLADIVKAIDGERLMNGCGLGLSECDSSNPCPVHDKFLDIRDRLKKMLETTTIAELNSGLDGKLTFKR